MDQMVIFTLFELKVLGLFEIEWGSCFCSNHYCHQDTNRTGTYNPTLRKVADLDADLYPTKIKCLHQDEYHVFCCAVSLGIRLKFAIVPQFLKKLHFDSYEYPIRRTKGFIVLMARCPLCRQSADGKASFILKINSLVSQEYFGIQQSCIL